MVFEQLLPGIELYLQVVRFMIVLAAGVVFTRLVLMPLAGRIAARRNADKVSIHSFSSLTGLVGLFMSFIVALQAAEFGNLVTVLGAITAALTVAVGFGMRDQISNIVGGFFIYTDSPFVKGDYIKVNDQEGVVQDIRLRRTVINGSSNEKVVVPNSVLTLNPVKNFTKGRETKTSIQVTTGLGDAEKFEELALEAVEARKDILGKPAPEIGYRDIGDGKVSLEVTYWVRDSDDVKKIRSQLVKSLTEKAQKAGIFAGEEKDVE